MSPLNIEAFNSKKGEWVRVAELKSGDPPGSISQNMPDGRREVYLFECAEDDSESIIKKSKGGIDVVTPAMRMIVSEGMVEIARLKDGEVYSFSIKTDTSSERRLIRFAHRNGKK